MLKGYSIQINKECSTKKGSARDACADPESFDRLGPTLTTFFFVCSFFEGSEEANNI